MASLPNPQVPRKEASTLVEEQHQAPVSAGRGLNLEGVVSSRAWQVAMLVIPILLTAWLTHVSSSSEGRVTSKIDEQMDQQKQVFAEQVQLSQDLYKRQFDTYDKLYAQLLILRSAIERLNPRSPSVVLNRRLADSLAELDSLRKTNRLHISDPVYKSMGDAWQKGARMNAQDLDQVEAQMEKEMKDLMDVDAKLRKKSASNKSGNSPRQN
jgi:hypothetical protein